MLLNKRPYKTWVEISRKALLHNLSVFRKIVGDKIIMAVVKAEAYGHGLVEVASVLKEKIDWFAVDNYEEGLRLRAQGIKKPILVLGYTPLDRLKESIEANLSLTVYDERTIKKLISLKSSKAKLHLKIETGLNRQGLGSKEASKLARLILKHSEILEIEGLSTHFANIEDTTSPQFAQKQLGEFRKTIKILEENGVKPAVTHCAASAATLLYPETHFDLVRVGISIYGLWPSEKTQQAVNGKMDLSLKPVLSWKSMVAQVKWVDKGDSIGYDRTWFAPKKSKVAVIPVGYSDGYDRGFSNKARVLINGKYEPVVGRVAMNMIVVDVTKAGHVKSESEVVLIGKQKELEVNTEELAQHSGTINYEIVSRINPNLPRIIV